MARRMLSRGWRITALKRPRSLLRRLPSVARIGFLDAGPGLHRRAATLPPFDAVVHCATRYGRGGESDLDVFGTNVVFALDVLDTATTGHCPLFVNADTSLGPEVSPYALAKAQFRDWTRRYADAGRIRVINARLEHFFGPGDDPAKFTTHVIRACLANAEKLDLTAGEQRRDFVFIDDVTDALALLVGDGRACEQGWQEFQVGSGDAVTVRSFVERVRDLTGARTKLNFGALPYRRHEAMLCQADLTAMSALGWHPRHSLEEGLRLTVEGEKTA